MHLGVLLERGFLRPRARRSRRRSAQSFPLIAHSSHVTCVGRDSMSPPSSPTRTPSTAGGLRRGEGLRLLRWPTAPSSSMGSIRFSSGGAARRRGHVSGFPSSCAKARFGGRSAFNFTSWHQLKACVRHRRIRARYSDFAICSCGGILQICQWYRVCDAGALRAEPLGHPLYLARSKQVKNRAKILKDRRLRRARGPHLPPAWVPLGPSPPPRALGVITNTV